MIELADAYTPYERGLSALLDRIGREAPAHAELLAFQQRLAENIRATRRDGDTEQRRADRASVIAGLNALASVELGVDFNTLCGLSAVAPRDRTNRAKMLDKVESFWIKGVLEQSLYQIARLELGLEQAPERIDHPWRTILQEAASKREIPSGTPMMTLFGDLDGKLLILGAPGAGKTTLLLELARDLIARARSDSQHPIPLVFNLSTWASSRKPLKEWLADELNQRYDVPRKLAQEWMQGDAVLPLLDGLDEVAAEQRAACVEAINAYRQERVSVSLAVCSRVEEYAGLAGKLKLQGAVVVQPLTQQTVDGYLRQVGRPLAAVRAALRDDPTLWELLDSPLLLSIVALAYKDRPVAALRAAGTPEKRRQIFDDYIAAMFGRRGNGARYTQQQTTQWLVWLANQMMSHSLTVFYIERIQPDWLSKTQRRQYIVWVRLFSGLNVGLSVGLIGVLIGGLRVGLIGVLIGGLFAGLLLGFGDKLEIIDIYEEVRWSWLRVREHFVSGLVSGLVGGLVGGLVIGVLFGLIFGLATGLLISLLFGLASNTVMTSTSPNEGIHRAARNSVIAGLVGGLTFGFIFGLVFGLVSGLLVGLVSGALFGLGGYSTPSLIVLQHYTLRWLLYRNGSLPFTDLVPFLDYCAERIFLRKVGGGYIFVHRLLMEHFASLYAEQPAEPVVARRKG
jgi:hypothetical protein